MVPRLRPPALELPDIAAVHWRSITKIIRKPEENWPAQICERPIISGHVGKRYIALIADPDAAKTVLTGSEEQFPRWDIYGRVVGAGAGRENLSVTRGEQWLRQRRAFAPMFGRANESLLLPLFQRAITRAIERWNVKGEMIHFDASLEMTRLTLDVIWQVLFGTSPPSDSPSIVAGAATEMHAALLLDQMDVQGKKLSELADAAEMRAPGQSLLSRNPFDVFGRASVETAGTGLNRQELYDNARVFLGAGHETTALTLGWALWLVAQDIGVQDRIHAELDRVVGTAEIDDRHLPNLQFTSQVLNETLRLFPPAFVTVRQTRDELLLAGERLPANAILAVCIYALHRHRNWWEEPDSFWPDRFGKNEPRHHYAYLPFSAGRHSCIGETLAWKEIITIFAAILQQFRVSMAKPATVKPRLAITLRPDSPLPIILHRRLRN